MPEGKFYNVHSGRGAESFGAVEGWRGGGVEGVNPIQLGWIGILIKSAV